uniref:Uncharacterized protein n=1 Tax=Anguilla anguilla TaxID=7936 RepID=A0A0E9SE64_ANGAN
MQGPGRGKEPSLKKSVTAQPNVTGLLSKTVQTNAV